MCTVLLLCLAAVVGRRGNHHRNPSALVSAEFPGAAKGAEAFTDANRRNHHGNSTPAFFL